MNMAGFYDESISNGSGGHRAVLFVSGCPHHCPGCHNAEAQNFSYGENFQERKQEILDRIENNCIIKGVTISGGEPLCKENMKEVLEFIKDVKKIRPTFNIWCYTGYTFEELENRNDEITKDALNEIDVLVDGEFVESKKNPSLLFRGSENQRILDVRKCINEQKIVRFMD